MKISSDAPSWASAALLDHQLFIAYEWHSHTKTVETWRGNSATGKTGFQPVYEMFLHASSCLVVRDVIAYLYIVIINGILL